MAEKKRKATSLPSGRPKKRQQTSQPVDVEHVKSTGILTPIIATTTGTTFPRNVKFQTYSKKTSNSEPNLLIHTSDHPTIDYTAAEGTDGTSNFLKHYVAVYDPSANKLQVTEAKSLTVRSTVRQRKRIDSSDDEQDVSSIPPSEKGTRAALTEAFGSKKSRKAVQSMAENRQLGQGGQGATIAEAMIAGISSGEEEEATNSLQAAAAAARTNKPLPRPNLATSEIEQVYSLSSLVFPQPASNTLKLMPIKLWTTRLRANKEVSNLRSRFVANRISYLGKRAITSDTNEDADEDTSNPSVYIQQLQVLRYIALLVEVAQYCAKQGTRKRLPWVDKWPEGTISNAGSIPSYVLKEIMKQFFPDSVSSQHALTLLRTTILALTLHISPPSGHPEPNTLLVEPTDIQLDLALEMTDVRKLYHELGCRVKAANERELMVWGYQKIVERQKKQRQKDKGRDVDAAVSTSVMQAPKPVFAVLKFPLEFPKVSMGRRPGSRR